MQIEEKQIVINGQNTDCHCSTQMYLCKRLRYLHKTVHTYRKRKTSTIITTFHRKVHPSERHGKSAGNTVLHPCQKSCGNIPAGYSRSHGRTSELQPPHYRAILCTIRKSRPETRNNKPDSQNILKGNYTDRFIKGGQ